MGKRGKMKDKKRVRKLEGKIREVSKEEDALAQQREALLARVAKLKGEISTGVDEVLKLREDMIIKEVDANESIISNRFGQAESRLNDAEKALGTEVDEARKYLVDMDNVSRKITAYEEENQEENQEENEEGDEGNEGEEKEKTKWFSFRFPLRSISFFSSLY